MKEIFEKGTREGNFMTRDLVLKYDAQREAWEI
jgi:hypothetical protein